VLWCDSPSGVSQYQTIRFAGCNNLLVAQAAVPILIRDRAFWTGWLQALHRLIRESCPLEQRLINSMVPFADRLVETLCLGQVCCRRFSSDLAVAPLVFRHASECCFPQRRSRDRNLPRSWRPEPRRQTDGMAGGNSHSRPLLTLDARTHQRRCWVLAQGSGRWSRRGRRGHWQGPFQCVR
jgi:hypothetical protein